MKLKCDFNYMQVAGRDVAVPVGEVSLPHDAVLFLNGVARFILKCLSQDITREELLTKLIDNYSADRQVIEKAMTDFLKELEKLGLVVDS